MSDPSLTLVGWVLFVALVIWAIWIILIAGLVEWLSWVFERLKEWWP